MRKKHTGRKKKRSDFSAKGLKVLRRRLSDSAPETFADSGGIYAPLLFVNTSYRALRYGRLRTGCPSFG